MSFRGRRNYNRGHHDRQQSHAEAPEEQLKKAIFTFGEHPISDLQSELKKLADTVRRQEQSLINVAMRAIQVAVIEQPHKIPFLASLIGLLYAPVDGSSTGDSLGHQVMQHCWKSCKESMEEGSNLRNLRPWIQLFSHLTVGQVVATESFLRFLQNIGHVLEELGASAERISQAAVCIIDALIRAGKTLWEHDATAIEALVKSIKANLSDVLPSDLTSPYLFLHSPTEQPPIVCETRTQLHAILNRLVELKFDVNDWLFPRVSPGAFEGEPQSPFTLEDIMLPPEQVDVSAAFRTVSTNSRGLIRFTISIFDDEITPAPDSIAGYLVRSVVANVADAYEANRKDSAQAFINLPRWLPGMFLQPPSANSESRVAVREGNWQLESTLVETLLGMLFNLPTASILPVHFASLICELCRLSPSTFGPAVGKCFRRLHDMTGEGLDVELSRRFAEWFAVHMSNFEFRWPPWEEWSGDLKLANNHPKKLFIRHVLDLEIRLAYYDRIVRSVPESFQSPDAGVMNDQAPGPEFAYSDPNHPYYAVAQEILNWLQGRTDPVEVISGIDGHKERLIDGGENEAKALSTLRQIVIQSLLEIGSRSFSHFLNAVERYIKLIRHISMETDSKPDILGAITQFWRKNPQMMLITLNKFMQYQFTEPSDHISWAFNLSNGMIGEPEWQILKEALDKANGRVFVVQKKVDQLRKEQDDAAALQKAQENADMDTDVIVDSERTLPQTAALTSALSSKEQLLLEQERCFELIFNNFIQALKPSYALFSPEFWERRGEWSDADHRMYETWGWFRHFCRSYTCHLIGHSQTLRPKLEVKLAEKNGVAEQMLQKYCALALSETQ